MNTENLPAVPTDGFDDLDTDGRLIQGCIIKFDATASPHWNRGDGGTLAAKYLPVGTLTALQKWEKQKPVETIIKEPGKALPNIDELNASVPANQWELGNDGMPKAPWQLQHIVYLVNPETAERGTFATGTIGGSMAVRELKDTISLMRKLKANPRLTPTVKLGQRKMKTKYGERPRPAFEITGWIGDDGKTIAAPTALLPTSPAGIARAELDDAIPF